MAFNEDLADRVRTLLVEVPSVSERKMFGGRPSWCRVTWLAGSSETKRTLASRPEDPSDQHQTTYSGIKV